MPPAALVVVHAASASFAARTMDVLHAVIKSPALGLGVVAVAAAVWGASWA
jgi:hypothetical protein